MVELHFLSQTDMAERSKSRVQMPLCRNQIETNHGVAWLELCGFAGLCLNSFRHHRLSQVPTEVQGKQPGYKSNTKLVILTQTCLHTEAAWIRRNAFSSGRGGTGMVLGRAEYGGGKQGANLPEEEN